MNPEARFRLQKAIVHFCTVYQNTGSLRVCLGCDHCYVRTRVYRSQLVRDGKWGGSTASQEHKL